MDTHNKKVIIWDTNNCLEIRLSKKINFDLFPSCEIKSGPIVIEKNKINIVIKDWFFWAGAEAIKEDLSLADLLICYTRELVTGPWENYYKECLKSFNNPNFIVVASGRLNLKEYPQDRVYTDLDHFSSLIADCCYIEKEGALKQKPKLFDALLGISKPHRLFVFEQLIKNNLESKSYINIWKKGAEGIKYRTKDLDMLEDPVILNAKIDHNNVPVNISAINIPGLSNGIGLSCSIPKKIYDNAWYSIIAETHHNNSDFFTEKTTKCFLTKRIFVFFGGKGQLKKIRELGYKTFNDIIDESYDEIDNDYQRWEKAFEQVIKLSKADHLTLYKKMSKILEHNQKEILNQKKRLQRLKFFLEPHIQDTKN